jgi:hypothetical protein
VARTEAAYRVLKHDVKHNRIVPHYLALVEGNLSGEDVIDLPIGNVKRGRGRLMVAREGRPDRPLQGFAALQGGRTGIHALRSLDRVLPLHQIRVHPSGTVTCGGGRALRLTSRSKLLPDRFSFT